MEFGKKYYPFLVGFGIIFLFFFTRLYNILSLPIFTDEAIYVRWSQIAGNDANWRFISLTDGKQPMFVWIAMILMRVIHEPLLAGRLVSVGAGFISMIGLFLLSYEVFKNKTAALLTSFIYVIFSFSLVYDRLALYDSLVAAAIIWCLYFEILLVRKLRLDLALILGIIIGFGMLTKTNADFALILFPFSLLLFNFKDKYWKRKLGLWFVFALTATFVANAMYAVLRLSPFYHIISDKNYVFIYPLHDWIQHPFAYLIDNMKGLLDWLISYTTLPFIILVLSSFLIKKYFKEKLLLLVWFVIPFVALAFFGRVIYPRFILFMIMPFLVLGGFSLFYMITVLKKFWLRLIVACVFLLMFVFNDFFILTDFAHASIPQSDKGQFVASWPSGVGVAETVAFLKEKAKQQKIYVGTEGTFGLMPYALEIYLHDNPNIKTVGFWPITDTPPKEVLDSAKKIPTYFVFYQPCPSCKQTGVAPLGWPVSQVFQIPKLEKGSFYTLYQVIPQ